MASETDFQPDLRLHPLSWLFALLGFLRQFIVPLVAALFVGARNDPELWGLIAAVPLVGAALWHQYTFRYGFGPRGLVIRAGFLFRNVRQIDYGRIENIDTARGPLHRLLGVAEVRVETSTGGKPEALIRVLGLNEAAELRDRVFSSSPQRSATAPTAAGAPQGERAADDRGRAGEEETLVHLSTGELVRFGLIDKRGIVLVVALVGVAYQNGLAEQAWGMLEGWLPALDEFEAMSTWARVTLGAALLVGALALLRLLSIVLALITLHDFRLTRAAREFRIRHGLLTRVALTLRLPRIQAVHQTATLMHRLLKRVSLSVDLAGDSGPEGEQGESGTRVRWLAPVVVPAQAAHLMQAALPEAHVPADVDWRPLAPGARGRIFRRTFVVAMLFALAPAIWLVVRDAFAWLGLLLVIPPLAWLHATAYVRYTRWALTNDLLLFRCGWLTRRLVVAPRNRVQTVRLAESPLDRRAGMAVVSADTAGASAGSLPIRVPYLERGTARELAAALYRSAAAADAAKPATDSNRPWDSGLVMDDAAHSPG